MAVSSINDKMLTALKDLKTDKSASTSLKADIDIQMDDWLTLLVAQLKNQDMDNQVDTTEMTSQLAQFSQIQAMQNLVSIAEDMYSANYTSYATSLIGKEITVAEIVTKTTTSGTTDELVTTKGKVTGVTLFEGEPYVYIGDKQFALSQVMVVGDVEGETTDSIEGSEGSDSIEDGEGSEGSEGVEGGENVDGESGGAENTEGSTGVGGADGSEGADTSTDTDTSDSVGENTAE